MSEESNVERSEWDKLIGPFYTADTFAEKLGITVPELQTLVKQEKVIETVTGDGTPLYPSFQTASNRQLAPHLEQTLKMLNRTHTSSWSVALWLNSPIPELNGRRPYELLLGSSYEVAQVLELATADAEARQHP